MQVKIKDNLQINLLKQGVKDNSWKEKDILLFSIEIQLKERLQVYVEKQLKDRES